MADPGASPPLATCRRMLPLKMFSLSLPLAGGEALAAQDWPPIVLPPGLPTEAKYEPPPSPPEDDEGLPKAIEVDPGSMRLPKAACASLLTADQEDERSRPLAAQMGSGVSRDDDQELQQ